MIQAFGVMIQAFRVSANVVTVARIHDLRISLLCSLGPLARLALRLNLPDGSYLDLQARIFTGSSSIHGNQLMSLSQMRAL
jgi:hypothetical protein